MAASSVSHGWCEPVRDSTLGETKRRRCGLPDGCLFTAPGEGGTVRPSCGLQASAAALSACQEMLDSTESMLVRPAEGE